MALENINKLKTVLLDFLSNTFTDAKLTYYGLQADRLINILKAIGLQEKYKLNNTKNFRVHDVKGGTWVNIQFIVPPSCSFNLFLEWSNTNDSNSLWSNAITAPSINITQSDSVVLDIKGYSFLKVRIDNVSPSNAEIEVRFRYT